MKSSLLALLTLFAAFAVRAAEVPDATSPALYLQGWLGGLASRDDAWRASDVQTGDNLLGNLGTLPFGGGAGQKLWGTGAWQIGFEGGGLATWKNGNTAFRGTGNGGTNVQVSFDNTFFAFGVFMGGVVSVNLARYVRLYAAGGPSLTWAWLHNDNNNDSTPAGIGGGDEDDGSFATYGRAGIEFVLDNGFTFGASVRYANDHFDFGDAGDLKLDEPLYLLTLGARLRE